MAKEPTGEDITEEQLKPAHTGRGFSLKMLVSAGVMALLIGGIAAWATANIGGSMIAFIVAAIASGYFLYQKPLPSAAVGTGMYITAGLLVLNPILFYVPVILGTEGADGAEEAGAFVGSILGLIIWGFVAFLIALVLFALGYFINKRAKKKLDDREKRVAS